MSGQRLQQEGRQGTGKKLEEQPIRQFAFRLCLQLGCPHPDYLLPQLTSRQLAEWIAYCNVHPFGQDRLERVVAEVGAALWNQNRGKSEAIKSDAFLPQRIKPQSPDQMKTMLRRYLPGGNR